MERLTTEIIEAVFDEVLTPMLNQGKIDSAHMAEAQIMLDRLRELPDHHSACLNAIVNSLTSDRAAQLSTDIRLEGIVGVFFLIGWKARGVVEGAEQMRHICG